MKWSTVFTSNHVQRIICRNVFTMCLECETEVAVRRELVIWPCSSHYKMAIISVGNAALTYLNVGAMLLSTRLMFPFFEYYCVN